MIAPDNVQVAVVGYGSVTIPSGGKAGGSRPCAKGTVGIDGGVLDIGAMDIGSTIAGSIACVVRASNDIYVSTINDRSVTGAGNCQTGGCDPGAYRTIGVYGGVLDIGALP